MTRKLKIQALEIKLQCIRDDREKEDNFLIRYRFEQDYRRYLRNYQGYRPYKPK